LWEVLGLKQTVQFTSSSGLTWRLFAFHLSLEINQVLPLSQHQQPRRLQRRPNRGAGAMDLSHTVGELEVFHATPRRREPTVSLTDVCIYSRTKPNTPIDLFDAIFK
jgi:hypothetical protein